MNDNLIATAAKDPKALEEQIRRRILMSVSLVVAAAIGLAAISNYVEGLITLAIFELVYITALVAIAILVKVFGYKNLLSDLVTLLSLLLVVGLIISTKGSSISAYYGSICVLVICYLVTATRRTIIIYSIISFVAIAGSSLFFQDAFPLLELAKFSFIYISLAMVLSFYKNFEIKTIVNAVKLTNQEKITNQKLQTSLNDLKEQKEMSDKFNQLTVDRELKMIELKKELKLKDKK